MDKVKEEIRQALRLGEQGILLDAYKEAFEEKKEKHEQE